MLYDTYLGIPIAANIEVDVDVVCGTRWTCPLCEYDNVTRHWFRDDLETLMQHQIDNCDGCRKVFNLIRKEVLVDGI